jgi:hypothetical protein
MREQDMRDRVERFLKEALRTSLLPAALGVGACLVSACRAHVSPDSGQSVTTESDSVGASQLTGPTDAAIRDAAHGATDAGLRPSTDASQSDPFPHSLLKAPAFDARLGGPGLTVDPGMRERSGKKVRAIYSAPVSPRWKDFE